MLDHYLRTITEKINDGTKVYLGPASMETVILARMLKNKYRVLPAGFCDNDAKKQGHHLNSMPELKIVSFDEALEDPQSEYLVVSPHHCVEIIGDLVFERKVSPDRIINYQPIEKKTTCPFFAHNWIISDQVFYCCCIDPVFDSKQLDTEQLVSYIETTRRDLIDGRIPLPETCKTCFHNCPSYINKSLQLNSFDFSFRGWCNYKCEYCSANQPDRKSYSDQFELEQYLEEFEKIGALNDIFSVLFAVGEPTINEKRFGLYKHCREKQYFLDIFSNCSVFDDTLFQLAHESPVIIRKSFDAGTPETYARIKGVNRWEKMLENVHRYVQAPYLALNPKYLFLPGVNDNERDVENFAALCAELRVDFVTPVFSFLDDAYEKSEQAQRMFKYLVDRLAEEGIFTANVDTLYSGSYHKLYQASF